MSLSPWATQTVTLSLRDASAWATATATLVGPGAPSLLTPSGARTPAWAVIRGGQEVPILRWGAMLGGVEVPLVHHADGFNPRPVKVGARPLGTTLYPVPTGPMLVVSESGVDSAAGTLAAPLRTLGRALTLATPGTTIVVRGGIYREGGHEAGAKTGVTVQNYPGEVVWFDGTTTLTGWAADGATWTAPYTLAYDRTLGVGSRIDVWSGVPTRVIVDQVWLDGTKLTAAVDDTTPAAGQFSVQRATGQLRIGSDPTGKTVRVAVQPFLLAASGITLRGIGVRRFAPQRLEWRGAAICLSDGATLEHCIVEHSSVDGIATGGVGCTIRRCTIQDISHSGMQGDRVNHGRIETSIIRRCNRAGYDAEPATAGIKISRTFEGLDIRSNHISDIPDGTAVWFDTTVSRSRIVNNMIIGTSTIAGKRGKSGIGIEGSDGGFYDGVQYWNLVVGNRVSGFRQSALIVSDSGYVKAWNNDLSAAVAVWAWQDYRENTGTKPTTEGTVLQSPWHTNNIEVVNNSIRPEATFNTQLRGQCNTDAAYKIAGGAMFSRIDRNWFRPQGSGIFGYLSRADGTAWSIRSTLASLESTPAEFGGPLTGRMAGNYQQTEQPTGAGAPLPPDIAALVGAPHGWVPPIGPIWPELDTTEEAP